MSNPILDDSAPLDLNNNVHSVVRTKDLVISEGLLLAASPIILGWIFLTEHSFLSPFIILLGPLVYIILWRHKSIQYEKNPRNPPDLQSAWSILLFLWSFIECVFVVPIAFFTFIPYAAKSFFIEETIFSLFILIIGCICLSYLFKSFTRSMNIDSKKMAS